jgi:RNA polymerase sigma-70 factor (ECF subfamily)
MGDAGSRSQVARLIGLSRQGDDSAREQLIAVYRPYLRLLAGRKLPKLIHKRADGSDIVQQTLVDAVRGLPDFRGHTEGEFTAWMLKLLEHNLLQSARRNTAGKRDVRREVQEPGSDGSAQLVWHTLSGHAAAPQNSVFRGEAALLLAQALEKLPEDQRTAVELRYLAQETLERIAAEMGKTPSAVSGLIRRGVETLRQHLPLELGEP